MHKDFDRVLLTHEQIENRITEMAAEIGRDYADKNPLFIGILKGSVFFFADLLRHLSMPGEIDFMSVSRYGMGSESSGTVRMLKDVDRPITGRHVVIVEDIVDSGTTLAYLHEMLLSRGPASVRICTLLDKPDRRKTPVDIAYCGFTIPDEFIVGYGIDYAEKYRLYPDIYVLSPSAYR